MPTAQRRRFKPLYIPRIQRFEVPSESRKEKKHVVEISEKGDAQCSCEDWGFNADPRYRCKHIKRAQALMKGQAH
jgi:hypothetical protein